MKNAPRFLSALLLVSLLGACSSYETATPMQLDYSGLGTIPLKVRDVEIADRSAPAASSAIMQPTIADAVRRWAADRLRATGSAGQGTVIIRDASFKAEPLKMETGMDSWFTRQQAMKYSAHAAVEVQAKNGSTYASASAEASRSVSVPEDPSPAEKQKAYRTLLDGLMNDLNQNLEQSIRQHMQAFTGN